METEEKRKIKPKRGGWKYMQLEVPAPLWKKIAHHRDTRMVGKDARITMASLDLIREGIERIEERELLTTQNPTQHGMD